MTGSRVHGDTQTFYARAKPRVIQPVRNIFACSYLNTADAERRYRVHGPTSSALMLSHGMAFTVINLRYHSVYMPIYVYIYILYNNSISHFRGRFGRVVISEYGVFRGDVYGAIE